VTPAVREEATVERVALDDTSWVDVARGWVDGADELYETLLHNVGWQTSRLFRYDHYVEERRLGAHWSRGRPLPHPALLDIHKTLQRRYGVQFNGFGMIQYRDGRDGQAFHRDTDMRWLDETVIAILTLGAQRPWYLRPRANRNTHLPNRGATHDLRPGNGDLIVMGGRAQADWEHSVPYLTHGEHVGVRISLQWRWTSGRGRPFMGSSYSAPLTYRRS
jgi:alkylated DNA repair dioxygenase AlkB